MAVVLPKEETERASFLEQENIKVLCDGPENAYSSSVRAPEHLHKLFDLIATAAIAWVAVKGLPCGVAPAIIWYTACEKKWATGEFDLGNALCLLQKIRTDACQVCGCCKDNNYFRCHNPECLMPTCSDCLSEETEGEFVNCEGCNMKSLLHPWCALAFSGGSIGELEELMSAYVIESYK